MSQASKVLKQIASGEEYKALVEAIEKADYQAIASSYVQVKGRLQAGEKEIVEKIQTLPRLNKDEDSQKFRSAFQLRVQTTLPKWYDLNQELQKQKVMEGVVSGFGSKGDPLVRTPEGRIVVVTGATPKEGDKIRFRVVAEGKNADFGEACELTADLFYSIINRGEREEIMKSLVTVEERLRRPVVVDEEALAELGDLLQRLEKARELTARLEQKEKERILGRILAYRKRLLEGTIIKLAFELLSRGEEREIRESLAGNEEEIARALSAPGLFRQEAHKALKTELFSGEKIKGYDEALQKLESNIDSMRAALELEEFKAGMGEFQSAGKRYMDKMDMFFDRLFVRARQTATSIAEGSQQNIEEIKSAVSNSFSGEAACSELRRVFRNAEEFVALRAALVTLRTKLGNSEAALAEAALKPYLRQKINLAFGERN
ncbi:MAG: hypothetical protein HY665_00805 [Chloroflexi bacterium]|nr:hypothetical protein [Chloroflexota bacterium]